jgi:hypothetical protein
MFISCNIQKSLSLKCGNKHTQNLTHNNHTYFNIVEGLSYKSKMNEDMEKIDSAKDSNSTEIRRRNKQKFDDDTLYATIDKTPYRGYGFTEVYKYTVIVLIS